MTASSRDWSPVSYGQTYQPPADKERKILEALGEGSGIDELRWIRDWLTGYLEDKEERRPLPSEDRVEVQEIRKLSERLIEELRTISGSAWLRLQERFHDAELQAEYPFHRDSEPTKASHLSFLDLEAVLYRLARATEIPVPMGRPKKTAESTFIWKLGFSWKQFHGSRARRSHRWQTGEESGPFRRFVEACIDALPPEGRPEYFPDAQIREYCTPRQLPPAPAKPQVSRRAHVNLGDAPPRWGAGPHGEKSDSGLAE